MTNAPVGDDYVNAISLMKRATWLSSETQVTLGGYCGGHPPPQNGPIFAQKRKQLTCAKFVFYFDPEQRFEQGAGSLAEGAREPEIAYASRIRLFSLASNPAGHPRKSNSPK
jgi:hypothetical protein